ncbi:hypothetical protein CFC21_068848, partial [Triticum aestivum]
ATTVSPASPPLLLPNPTPSPHLRLPPPHARQIPLPLPVPPPTRLPSPLVRRRRRQRRRARLRRRCRPRRLPRLRGRGLRGPDLDLGLGRPSSHPSRKRPAARGGGSLVPERWKDAVEEINLTKKEKRRIAHGLRFGSRLDRRVPSAVAAPDEYRAYREGRLDAELGHGARDYLVSPLESRSRAYSEVRLDAEPGRVASNHVEPLEEMSLAPEKVEAPPPPPPGTRAAPRNPRTAMDSVSLEDIAELFNSSQYVPGETEDGKSARSRRKLFTDEEKVLLNRRLPDLEGAASSKWLPLHTLAASGDFYLLDNLLKHKVDVNALDKDGLPAIHKAIISKKHAIINYLLRNSANPSVCDRDGATLMHYAVQTACNQTIKTLLLYNVDINRPDDYGWTPLHLAVQTQRTDIVRLLLLKGANRTLKNQILQADHVICTNISPAVA